MDAQFGCLHCKKICLQKKLLPQKSQDLHLAMSFIVWMFLILHSVSGHNYAVACKTSLALSGHRRYQFQTVLGSGQVKLRRNREILACGSELLSGESLGIDVQNMVAGGVYSDHLDKNIINIYICSLHYQYINFLFGTLNLFFHCGYCEVC